MSSTQTYAERPRPRLSPEPVENVLYPNYNSPVDRPSRGDTASPGIGRHAPPPDHDSLAIQELLDRELASQLQQEELEDSADLYSDGVAPISARAPWRSTDEEHMTEDYARLQQELDDEEYARMLADEEHRILREAPAPERECAVCGETVQVEDLPSLANCGHRPETCAECYANWIKSELDNKRWDQVKCPARTCSVILQHQDVKQYASNEVYRK